MKMTSSGSAVAVAPDGVIICVQESQTLQLLLSCHSGCASLVGRIDVEI